MTSSRSGLNSFQQSSAATGLFWKDSPDLFVCRRLRHSARTRPQTPDPSLSCLRLAAGSSRLRRLGQDHTPCCLDSVWSPLVLDLSGPLATQTPAAFVGARNSRDWTPYSLVPQRFRGISRWAIHRTRVADSERCRRNTNTHQPPARLASAGLLAARQRCMGCSRDAIKLACRLLNEISTEKCTAVWGAVTRTPCLSTRMLPAGAAATMRHVTR